MIDPVTAQWNFSAPVTLTGTDPATFIVNGGTGNPVSGTQITATSWQKLYGVGVNIGDAWSISSPFTDVLEAASIASPQSGLVT